mmetsp:Transcript_1707/g.7451  ORF Transcript_1707/g.7451 Transcript_1707/m.7451 type:complete len:210 (-) Transcript_1707:245-874(-)|eukprot:scaffold5443_cov291-Pinguiococcus_pyrenoidosus.AAC.3
MATAIPTNRDEKRRLANEILEAARQRGIQLPSADDRARPIVGRAMMQIDNAEEGTVLEKTLRELETTRGVKAESGDTPSSAKRKRSATDDSPTKKRKTPTCTNAANEPINLALNEMARLFFKEAETDDKKKFAAMALVKLCKFIRMMEEEITSGKQVRTFIESQDPSATRCCGPKQQKRINEIIASPDDTFAELVEKREEMAKQAAEAD